MDADIAFYTAQGKRDNNEDAVTVMETGRSILAVVADGLGGHSDGEIASQQAVDTLRQLLIDYEPDEDILIDAIQEASKNIFSMHSSGGEMLTTVAALWIGRDLAVVANVGDTRIYQFRNGEIIYQSLDHSKAQMAVLVGQLDYQKIRHSKDRNRLIRVLGTEEAPRVDCRVLSIQPGDRFLLCSDGFWEPVTEGEMQDAILKSDSANHWLKLMQQAVEDAQSPTQDNHSAIAVRFN